MSYDYKTWLFNEKGFEEFKKALNKFRTSRLGNKKYEKYKTIELKLKLLKSERTYRTKQYEKRIKDIDKEMSKLSSELYNILK